MVRKTEEGKYFCAIDGQELELRKGFYNVEGMLSRQVEGWGHAGCSLIVPATSADRLAEAYGIYLKCFDTLNTELDEELGDKLVVPPDGFFRKAGKVIADSIREKCGENGLQELVVYLDNIVKAVGDYAHIVETRRGLIIRGADLDMR